MPVDGSSRTSGLKIQSFSTSTVVRPEIDTRGTKRRIVVTSTLTQALASHGPIANRDERVGILKLFDPTVTRLDRFGFGMLRLGLVVVLCWIGGLKAANFEAEGIVPFVANSPVMNFFYHHPAPEYREHNPAGGLNVENRAWNETNGTYAFSYGLGCVIVAFGLLIALIRCLHRLPWSVASSWS